MPNEFDLLSPTEQQQLLEWCDTHLIKIKTINRKHTSYGLKHIFEGSKNGFYISNGAFKGAMLKLGFDYLEIENHPNWFFNVSEKSIKNARALNRE